MIYVNLRTGDTGCGVVGDNLMKALRAFTPLRRVSPTRHSTAKLPGPLLERLDRLERRYTATRHVAYCVFEHDLRARRLAIGARDLYDSIAPASHWCEQVLRDAGLTAVTTIHQGVDGSVFNPSRAVRRRSPGQFAVFSGGKFELRKGQDIVVKAFRVFAERHRDAVLIASWQQPWTRHAMTMVASPHVPFSFKDSENAANALGRWLVGAGLDPSRVELVPPLAHAEMVGVYADTDVGLFPNRCEGGTNLVMMEYMACGRPVIATDFSGHRDVISGANSLRLQRWQPLPIVRDGEVAACWCEPDIEEVVESLEVAYRSRDRLQTIGRKAASDLRAWTWDRAASSFLRLLGQPIQ